MLVSHSFVKILLCATPKMKNSCAIKPYKERMFHFEVANNILANLVVIWLQYQKTYYLTKPIMVSTCMKLVLTFSAFNILINAQK